MTNEAPNGVTSVPRIHFHQQLDELKDKLLAMAALTQQAVESAVEAYLQRDDGLRKFIKQSERAIDRAQNELDEMAYELLAKEQPMAVDLRFIVAVIKIGGDLERTGDQAMAIGKRTKEILTLESAELPVDFDAMGEFALHMTRSAVQALLEGDAALAESVREMEDEIDRMYLRAFDSLLKLIQEKPQYTKQAMNGILVAKNLEHIADHASNIATDVIFWVRGADLRHQLSMAMD
jgi:phosphate transport system protein